MLGVNNQRLRGTGGPRGGRMERLCIGRGPACMCVCVCVGGSGGGLGQWDTASWNLAFCEAPCLIGGREVNSSAPKLYLIFIHMNAPGRDRLPQTN